MSSVTSIKNNFTFYILLAIIILGFTISAYFTIKNVHVPINQEIVSSSNEDIFVIVKKENNIAIPISEFFTQGKTQIDVDIYFKNNNLTKDNFLSPPLLSSNTSSILSLSYSIFRELDSSTSYNLTFDVGHPLYVGNYSGSYNLIILYRPNDISPYKTDNNVSIHDNYPSGFLENATITHNEDLQISKDIPSSVLGKIKILKIPLQYEINSLDFSRTEYFWIIALGVLISRVFSVGHENQVLTSSIKFGTEELIWIPFSAVITLLIFSSFVNQITLTSDIILNLSLAFGFGFGFDKILEVWKKAPSR